MIHESNPNAWRADVRRHREQMRGHSTDTIIANHDQSIDFIIDGTYGVAILSATGDVMTLTPDGIGCVQVETQHGVFDFEFAPSGNVAVSFRPAEREAQPKAPEPRRWSFDEVWRDGLEDLL